MTDLHKLVKEKFTSGNHILVERIMLTRQEYEAALAQTPQKPDAWMHVQGDYAEASIYEMDKHYLMQGWDQYPLYAAPPSKQEPAEYDAPALYKAKAEREKAEKQEPVAWHYHNPDYPIQDGDWVEVIFTSGQPDDVKKWTPLYTAPQKPDVTLISEGKTWQGLTDEEINKLMQTINWRKDWLGSWAYKEFARAIEAKLREKNT